MREILQTIAIGYRVETKGRPKAAFIVLGAALALVGIGLAYPDSGILFGKGMILVLVVLLSPVWLPAVFWFAGRAEVRRTNGKQAQIGSGRSSVSAPETATD